MKKILIIITIGFFFLGCDKEFVDPSRPDVDEVFGNRDGVVGVSNGLQSLWSVGRQSPVYAIITANGFSTQELRILNVGNVDEAELSLGGATLTPKNGVLRNLWTQSLVIKSESQKVLDNVNVISDKNERENVIVHASIFKALALGTLIQFYEKVPLKTGTNAVFNSRTEVLNEVIKTLQDTQPYLNTANGFTALINSIKYKNTVNALLARYYMMLGDYDNALIYANLVNLTIKSTFLYDATRPNPIADSSIIGGNNYQPINVQLGLPSSLLPSVGDARVGFYTTASSTAIGFFNDRLKLIPVYLPGEIILIKAEAYARKLMLPEAVIELNKVLTKTAALDAFGIGANRPVYSGVIDQTSILTEIYRNRCIELYMSGLKIEDSRRFGRTGAGVIGAERNRNYYPYPDSERFNNTNTPADPAN
jgi:starch-binding outer membrane protein, SusD/RagB family